MSFESAAVSAAYICSSFSFFSFDGVDVRRDQEVFPLQLPRFKVVSVLLHVEQGSLAHDFRCDAVTFGKLTSEESSLSGFIVESFSI